VVGLAAGGDHSIVLLSDGTIAAWGANYSGQTLVPTQVTNVVAISAGGAHSLALAGTAQVNVQATVGASAFLTAGSLGGADASFQWQLNGLDLAGATNATLGIDFVTWTNADVYRAMVNNIGGLTVGPPIVLTVLAAPLRFDASAAGLQVTNSALHLRLLGPSGLGPVVIYASSDFLTWQPILTNPPVIGPVEFDDVGITNAPVRFYRASEAR
jgi:hypothetical protein